MTRYTPGRSACPRLRARRRDAPRTPRSGPRRPGPMTRSAASRESPRPSARPRRRLRDSIGTGEHQIAERREAHEGSTSSAPSARPSRIISASPRVISATRVLAPKPMPSAIPRADRDHVLDGAAHLDSDDVRLRIGPKLRPRQTQRQLRWQIHPSRDATVMAVGSPAPTSRAKVGPDRTATGRSPPARRPPPDEGGVPCAARSPCSPTRCACRPRDGPRFPGERPERRSREPPRARRGRRTAFPAANPRPLLRLCVNSASGK